MPLPGFLAGWRVSPFLAALPIPDPTEAVQLLPGWMQEGDMPVRDAVMQAAAVAVNAFTSDAAEDAAQTNAAYATGDHLDMLGLRVLARAENETDASYRTRLLLGAGAALTPAALLAAIDALMAPFGKAGAAYYCELDLDDVWLCEKTLTIGVDGSVVDGAADGMFFGVEGVGSVDVTGRRYDARGGRCVPHHPFLFGSFRSQPAIEGTGDYTDAFNQRGHLLIGLPPFDPPDEDAEDAAYMQTGYFDPLLTNLPPLTPFPYVNPDGTLTDEALRLDATTCTLFDSSHESDSAAIFTGAGDAAAAVLGVRALLESRASFPSTFTIVLDPELA
jgi:hypothetical protein